MSEDHAELAQELFPVDRCARQFPVEWKDVWFRERQEKGPNGIPVYRCPICREIFDHSETDLLHGDHVWPYALFGETSWQNYQLICGKCNIRKRDYLDREIRKALLDNGFHRKLSEELTTLVELGQLRSDVALPVAAAD